MPRPGRTRRLGRILEWNAAVLVAILAVGLLGFPVADSIFPEQISRCGWAGWVGFPAIICPADTAGGAIIEIVMNLPVSVLNLFLFLAYAAAMAETSAEVWRSLLIPQFAAAVIPAFLLLVLVKRGVVAGVATLIRWMRA
jgi:hypothetical protein